MDEGHREWLSAQTFEQAGTELAFIDNLAACDGLTARKDALDERLSSVVSDPEFWPLVRRLRAFRGIDTLSALIIVLEVSDFTRFSRACSSDRGRGWCPPASSPASPITMGRSPRPAQSTLGGSSSRRPGITPARRGSGARSTSARRGCPTMSCKSHDAPRAASTGSTDDAGAQQAGQRDHRRVRARARLLSLGRRHRAVAHTDSPSPLGWGGAGPRSPLVRAMVLWAALTRPRPILDTRQPATQPGTWGSQPPHMRLTDVENFARRLPTRATPPTNPPNDTTEGTFNAAHSTDAPPYDTSLTDARRRRLYTASAERSGSPGPNLRDPHRRGRPPSQRECSLWDT